MEKEINYESELQSLLATMFIRYNGVNIEKIGTDFKVFGRTYPTLELAKKEVDFSINALGQSLNRLKS